MASFSKRSKHFGILLLATLLQIALADLQQESPDDGKLIFAHVIFRHGDRTPIEPYPTDPYKDPKYWSTGWGQLTNGGKQRHLELGQWLRNRYRSILSDTFSVNEIYIRSTDVDRTLMSAQSNLAGLYPPLNGDVWNPSINWQPIPVHTMPEDIDAVLAAKKSCPAFDKELSRYKHSEDFQAYNKSLESMYEYVTAHVGRKVDSLTTAQNLYSNLHIEDLNNFTLPDWTKQVYPEPLRSISAKSFAIKTNTTLLARLKTGLLIKEMLQRFQDKVNNKLKPDRSAWIYSAHDTTVANVLNSLRIFDLHNPPFAACVLVELYRSSSGAPYVSVFYKNTTAEPQALVIPNCGQRCPLEQMFKVYADILPDDWKRECQISFLSLAYMEADIRSPTSIISVVFLSMMAVLVVLLVVVAYRKRHGGFHNDKWYLRIDG
ncbi:prostatic acid phosphatase [Uranotaenia lowii]|uniref:prostatic acid phosphatase n=1 Tax=Uranotaenia lowii TaxID=190385 RepID=UPI00247A9A53|nr:prostatic acid phosphatase [Uranotaenia lowii]